MAETTHDPSIEFRVGTLGPPSGLDPRTAKDTATHTLLRQIFEPPYVIREGKTVPHLFAELLRREPGDDKQPIYSAPVVKDAVFSDGTPLSAEIAARSLAKTKSISDMATVRHKDDRVYFHLEEPKSRFDLVLTETYCSIILERGGSLIGTGAFMFEQERQLRAIQSASSIRLIRNPFFRRTAAMESVRFDFYPPESDGSPAALLAACARGEVDFTAALTSLNAANVPLDVVYPNIQNGVSVCYLTFNTESPALSDRRLRRALAVGLDKTAVAKTSFEKNPLAFTAKGILPPIIDPNEPELFPHNLGEAQRILSETGVPKSNLRLLVIWAPRPYVPNPKLTAEEIKRQYEKFGIGVEIIIPRSAEDYYSALASGRYDMVLSGWIPDTPDPADIYDDLLSSKKIQKSGFSNANANNLSRLRSEALDRALDAFRKSPTPETRSTVHAAIKEEVPMQPLMKGQAVVVLSRRVRNFEHAHDGVYAFEELTISKT